MIPVPLAARTAGKLPAPDGFPDEVPAPGQERIAAGGQGRASDRDWKEMTEVRLDRMVMPAGFPDDSMAGGGGPPSRLRSPHERKVAAIASAEIEPAVIGLKHAGAVPHDVAERFHYAISLNVC